MSTTNGVAHQLIDALRSVGRGALSDREEPEAAVVPRAWHMAVDGLTRDICDRGSTPLGLLAEPRVQLVGKHDRGALHAYSISTESPPVECRHAASVSAKRSLWAAELANSEQMVRAA
jgi:hypothetical protein